MKIRDDMTGRPEMRHRDYVILAVVGFAAGAISGTLGAGGGVVTVFAVAYFLKRENADERDVFANSLIATAVVSAVSAVGYAAAGSIAEETIARYAAPAAAGGAVGAMLLGILKGRVIKIIFAVIVIYSGLRMMFG